MKNKIIIAILAFTSFSCSLQTNNNDVKPTPSSTPKPTESIANSTASTPYPVEPTLNPQPRPTPIVDTTGLYLYGRDESFYCEKKENIKVKLDRPVNIAVKKDGSEIYVVNGKCFRKPYFKDISGKFGLNSDYCNNSKDPLLSGYLTENNPIYKINKKGKLELVKGDREDLLYCSNDGEITLDEKDNLYFSENRRVYKLNNNNKVELMFDLDYLERINPKTGIEKLFFNRNDLMIGGIRVKENKVFLDMINGWVVGRKIEPTPTPTPIVYPIPMHTSFETEVSYTKHGVIRVVENNTTIRDIIANSRGDSIKYFWEIHKNNVISSRMFLNNPNNTLNKEAGDFLEKVPIETNFTDKTTDYEIITNIDKVVCCSNHTISLKINSKGEIFLNNSNDNVIWKINLDKKDSVFGGSISKKGYRDGKVEDALFNNPTGLDIDDKDNIYVADTGNNAIRKITPEGIVTTIYKEPS